MINRAATMIKIKVIYVERKVYQKELAVESFLPFSIYLIYINTI